MTTATRSLRHCMMVTLFTAWFSSAVGCGATSHHAQFDSAFAPKPGTSVRVGTIVDAAPKDKRGSKKDLDLTDQLRTELHKKLAKAGLDASVTEGDGEIVLNSRILDYDPGNAFGRWLVPGSGSTILSVECELEEEGQSVGAIRAMRTVSSGGAYSIGQWKTVFANVAEDIVKELKMKLKPKQ